MLIVSIILIIISILLIIQSVRSIKRVHKINISVDKENEQKQERLKEIESALGQYLDKIDTIKEHITEKQKELDNLQTNVTKTIESQKKLSQTAFESYCEVLIKSYDEKEKEYNENIERLKEAYADAQEKEMENLASSKEKIDEEIAEAKEVLNQIRATRAAALQAQLREKEILENQDNFRLNLSEINLKDIRLLKSIQPEITNSIVIDKIIQSNYYQPLAKTRFPQIIGKPTTCGIYKITSLKTGLSYIGQSNDICDRQKQHCKNALGVGTVTTENKLYKSMREDGLSNFTFEVLEECEAKLLDEKEKYYIGLYDTYNYGLNSNRGVG